MVEQTEPTARLAVPTTFVEVLIDALCAEGRWCRGCGEEMLLDVGVSEWTCLLCGVDELCEELVSHEDYRNDN